MEPISWRQFLRKRVPVNLGSGEVLELRAAEDTDGCARIRELLLTAESSIIESDQARRRARRAAANAAEPGAAPLAEDAEPAVGADVALLTRAGDMVTEAHTLAVLLTLPDEDGTGVDEREAAAVMRLAAVGDKNTPSRLVEMALILCGTPPEAAAPRARERSREDLVAEAVTLLTQAEAPEVAEAAAALLAPEESAAAVAAASDAPATVGAEDPVPTGSHGN